MYAGVVAATRNLAIPRGQTLRNKRLKQRTSAVDGVQVSFSDILQ